MDELCRKYHRSLVAWVLVSEPASFGNRALPRSPRLHKQVYLKNRRGETLGYATSWWCRADYDKHLAGKQRPLCRSCRRSSHAKCLMKSCSWMVSGADKSLPIWKSLASRRTEVFREILEVYSGSSAALCEAFGIDATTRLWGRHYLFWHQGKPMTMIYEVFNPKLSSWLGPSETTEPDIDDAASESG